MGNTGKDSAIKTCDKLGTLPKAPVVKSLTAGKKKLTVTLKGSKPFSVTKYKVQYRVSGVKKWSAKTYSATGTKYVIKNLKKGKKYQVRVCAVKESGLTSKYSKAKTSKAVK